MKKLLVLTSILSIIFLEAKAQLSPEATSAGFNAYPIPNRTGNTAWENDFDSYEYSNRWFRLLEPNNYDSNREELYPLFIFFHGAGEGSTDNRRQLRWGGQFHRNAVRQNPVKFDGLLLYPQIPSGLNWKSGDASGNFLNQVRDIVIQLVNHFNVDPTRIYINGLSMGGGGTWEFFLRNPEMVATAYPMCDNSSSYFSGTTTGRGINGSNISKLNSISTTRTPLWYSQGGLDGTSYALPGSGNNMVEFIRDAGGEIRYLYFPNLGHNVWDATWAQANYFTNMLSKSKSYIIALDGQTSFCPGSSINLTLTITAGYAGYEWQRSTDGVNWSAIGSNSNNLAVNQEGYYRVRFNWGSYWGGSGTIYYNQWTEWSEPILIDDNKIPDSATTINSNGKSVNLPGLDGATSVTLMAESDNENYQWLRNGSPVGSNSNTLNTSTAGTHTVRVWSNAGSEYLSANGFNDIPVEYRPEPAGCQSDPSNAIVVTTTNGPGTPTAPSNFFVTAISSDQIKIDWDDQASNELGFEIYRATQSGGPYQIITITEPKNETSNPQSYIDGGRLSNTTYYYRMRAVNENGGSSYTQEKSTTTSSDDQNPTPPTLEVKGTTRNTVKLQWFGSIDNSEVVTYEIYRNGQLTNSISAPTIITDQTRAINVTNTGNCTWVEYQAEDGIMNSGTVDSNWTGFTGSGFANTNNSIGSYLEINVNAPASGTYNLRMRFANGASSRPVSVAVNGSQQIASLDLPSTGGWENWTYADFSVPLSAGNNTVRFTSNTSGGAPNIDRIDACTGNLNLDEVPVYEYIVTGLSPLTNYSFYVKGVDANGNVSPPSNLVTAATINQGLNYKFYTHSGLGTVDNITTSGTLQYEGNVDNFDISVRNVNDYFAFVFEGQIVIPTTGDYKFYTSSDDGSKLYINDILRVNNDGDHGCNEVASSTISLTAGSYSIRVLMYENAGGECLEVRWEGPGITKQIIPDAAFTDNFTLPSPPNAPSGLSATAASHSQINLTWSDNSNDETGFEIYRRTGTVGDFAVINSVSANTSSFSDNNLLPSTQYYYQIRAINNNGGSTFSNSVNATTLSAPTAPNIPGNLAANFVNNSVQLSWVDNSSDEVGFEIYRTTSSDFSNWTLITTTTADIEGFIDNNIYVNSTYYYKMRAKGAVLFSDFTDEVIAVTTSASNNPPIITPLPNTTMVINEVLAMTVEVSDPDEDAVLVDFELSPSATFAQLTDGDLIFSPGNADYGVYTVTITADDGNGGIVQRTFTLTVLENAPVLPPNAPSNITATALSPASINLNWTDNADNEDGFRIYRSTDFSGPYVEINNLGQNITSFEDSNGLTGNTTYYYQVVSYNSNDVGESPIISITTLNSPPVIDPINSIYLNAGESISINVSATDPEGHAITLIPFNFPDFMSLTDNGDGTGTINITTQNRHVGSYGGIRIIASDALSDESSENIFVIVGNTQFEELIYLNLDLESDAGSPWNNTGGANGITDLTNVNGANTGISFSHSGTITAADDGYTHPSNNGLYDNKVILSKWTGSPNLTFNHLDPDLFYNILIFGSDNSVATTDYAVGTTTKNLSTLNNSSDLVSFSVSGQPSATISLTNGVVNAIVLQAYDGNTLPAPTNLTARSISYSSIELQWKGNAGNATGYEIYRRELPSGSLTLLTTVGSNVESYEDTGLPANTSFEYAVRAVNNSLNSAFTPATKASTFEHVVKINFNTDSEGGDGYVNSVENVNLWGYWNNINYTPPVYPDTPLEDAQNENGESTSIGLSIAFLNAAAVNNFGVETGDNSGVYPDQVMKTFHFVEGYGIGVEEWVLTNLEPGKYYNLSFFTNVIGTVLDDFDMSKALTKFEVNGVSKELEPRDNISEIVTFEKVSPNENGEISFKFSPANNTIRFGVLNAMVIEVYKNPNSITPTKTYYAQTSTPINVPGSWRTEPGGGGEELANLQEDGNELIISENSTLSLNSDVNFGGIGTKLKVTSDATISIDASVNNVFINALEVDEGVALTFNGNGGKNIRIGDGGLTIAAGASINLGNNSLTLNGNATINSNGESGQLIMNNGSLTFNSTSQEDSHLYLDDVNNNIADLEINNTGFGNVQLMTPTNLRNVLKLSAGNLDTKDNLVLVHDANGVALIDKVEVGASLTGMVEYQRYWERGGDYQFGYYHLGVPVKGQRLIDWNGDFYIQGTDFNKPRNFANVQYYDESTSSYVGMKNGNDLLEAGKGYTAFMYSSELVDGNVFYNNTGIPVIGNSDDNAISGNETFEFPLTYSPGAPDPGWNFLSNPYPCAIDFDNFDWENDAQNIVESIYVYDSEAFQFVPWNYEMVPASLKIYPGQGFFIKTNGVDPIFRISENVKTTDLNGAKIYRKGVINNVMTITVSSSTGRMDKTYFGYKDDATDTLDLKYDAPKIFGKSISLTSILRDSVEYSINAISTESNIKSIPLRLESGEKTSHELSINGLENFTLDKVFYLNDHYTNETILLPKETFEYQFEVNSESESSYDRFSILTIPKPEISISENEGFSNETVSLELKGKNLESVSKINLEIKWDPSEAKFSSLDSLNSFIINDNFDTSQSSEGIIKFNLEISEETISDIEKLFSISLIPLVDNIDLKIDLVDNSASVYLEDEIEIPADLVDGKIKVFDKQLVKGKVFYKASSLISKYKVDLFPDKLQDYPNSSGEYEFLLKENHDYALELSDINFNKFDINVIDLIALAFHLNGRYEISNPIDQISADIDENGVLDYKDLSLLTKDIFSYRKKTKSSIGKKWIVANHFSYLDNGTFPKAESIAEISNIYDYDIDYNTSILGDIINDFPANNRRTSQQDTTILTFNKSFNGNELFLNIQADSKTGYSGFQFTMEWNKEQFSLKDINDQMEGLSYEVDEDNGTIKFIWINEDDLDLNNKLSLLNFKFERKNQQLNQSAFDFKVIDSTAIFIDQEFNKNLVTFNDEFSERNNSINILNTFPNPFTDDTHIVFSLDRDQEVQIVIYNTVGEKVVDKKMSFKKGYNEWIWKPEVLLPKGIYIYHLNGIQSQVSGKVIFK